MPGWAGTSAGVGDLVQARRNAWHLHGWEGNTAAPVNRTTYRVTGVRADGGLTVAPVTGRDPAVEDGPDTEQVGEPLQLPPAYVRAHVTLAYASTVHAAHGRTVDTGHAVIGAGVDAAAAYVQLTRGREGNTAFVITRNTSGDAATGETHTVAERDAAAVLADAIRPPETDPNRTALTEAEHAADRARSTMTQVDPMLAVIAEDLTGRTAMLLDRLAADGTLPEHHRVALAADEARGTLDQLVRTAELAGHDPAQVLRDAVTATPLDGAASVAQVLHFRIRTALEGKLDPHVGSYTDLIPRSVREDPDAVNRGGLHALAEAADLRRADLGAQLAADPPQWAREALGPVPDTAADPAGRAVWEQRAGWAGSYRELVDHDDVADPLGAAPPAGLVEKHAVFRAAHHALDLPAAGADEEQMSEGQLRARVVAAHREEVWAPRYVADELDATHEALRTARTDATVWAARAAAEPDTHAAEQLRAAAQTAHDQAVQLAEQVDALTAADDARSLWLIETAVTRDRGERARQALGLRGIDVDHPDDRVTAQEWLDTDTSAKLAADPERPITEHDLAPAEHTDAEHTDAEHTDDGHTEDDRTEDGGRPADRSDDTDAPSAELPEVDTPQADPPQGDLPAPAEVELPELRVPDIRDVAAPDAGERADPQQRRRVPLPDETTTTVDRALLAVAEVEARRTAEAAALDEPSAPTFPVDGAPDRNGDRDDERREQLIRWADHNVGADPTTDMDDSTDDTDELAR